MGFISGIWLVVLGILGAASLIIARKPDAAALIGKLAPFQGWIGAISALWGVWGIVNSILNLGWLSAAPVFWVTYLAASVLQFGLGLLLGVGVIKTFVQHPDAVKRMDDLIARLAPKQGIGGIAAMCVGCWMVVSTVLFGV